MQIQLLPDLIKIVLKFRLTAPLKRRNIFFFKLNPDIRTEAAKLSADAAQTEAPDRGASGSDLRTLSSYLGERSAPFVDRRLHFQQSVTGGENVCGHVRGRKHCDAHREYTA